MKRLLLAFVVLFVSLPLVGCGSDEPAMVADPNDYAPYQASPEEIKAQQAESMNRKR
jgi:predicted small lipoprotein YifL